MSNDQTPVHEPLPARLAHGYTAFCNGRLTEEQGRFRHLAEVGQTPPVLLIGCCDSRVSPEVIFDAGPGEIFVVRNIGALVPPFAKGTHYQETSAAIEYAVLALGVAHVVVMGHAQCGGIRAFALGTTDEYKPLSEADFVANWKQLIQPAYDRLGPPVGDFDHYCETCPTPRSSRVSPTCVPTRGWRSGNARASSASMAPISAWPTAG